MPDPRVAGPWEGSYSKLFYGGDLQGIIDKLDYLQDLGVTTLYLNPIFESPSNHKYDTTNYEVIDDNFGDLATFQALVAELEARDMHLVLDGVFNHTSSDSRYFDRYGRYSEVGACEDVNSPYRSWYYFTPGQPAGTGACAGDTNYQAWWGFDSLPKLNTTDDGAGVRDYLYRDSPAIGAYWLEPGRRRLAAGRGRRRERDLLAGLAALHPRRQPGRDHDRRRVGRRQPLYPGRPAGQRHELSLPQCADRRCCARPTGRTPTASSRP